MYGALFGAGVEDLLSGEVIYGDLCVGIAVDIECATIQTCSDMTGGQVGNGCREVQHVKQSLIGVYLTGPVAEWCYCGVVVSI